jgi:hypothetical protein
MFHGLSIRILNQGGFVMRSSFCSMMLAMFLMVLASGCGQSEPAEGTGTADSLAAGDVVADTAAVVEIEVVLYPEGTLDPSMITPDRPVSAAALYNAYFAWNGKPVTVVGYPHIPYLRDTLSIESDLEMIIDPVADEILASVTFAAPVNSIVNKGELLAVSGTVEMSWTGDLEIIDAVMAPAPEAFERLETSPYAYDGVTPIPVDQIAEMVYALLGKEVTVEGTYHSTTTSTTDYGVTVRVDLSDPSDEWTKLVGCEMAGEIPAASDTAISSNREGVQIRGTVTTDSFSMVGLEGCVLINR